MLEWEAIDNPDFGYALVLEGWGDIEAWRQWVGELREPRLARTPAPPKKQKPCELCGVRPCSHKYCPECRKTAERLYQKAYARFRRRKPLLVNLCKTCGVGCSRKFCANCRIEAGRARSREQYKAKMGKEREIGR